MNIVRMPAIVPSKPPTRLVRPRLFRAGGSSRNSISTLVAIFCMACCSLLELSGCAGPLNQRTIYEAKGIQIGVESDHTTNDGTIPPILNSHPAQITTDEVRTLLGSLEVSGWSGIIFGIFETPHPKPVFTGTELMSLAEPFAKAFGKASPRERVFFSLQNPNARYDTDRTAGSMFLRDDYLHVVLWDHYGFQKADPGGGEQRDPRDTKGMKLWVMRPAQAATVPESNEPRWDSFEKVHVSLNVRDVLAALGGNHSTAKQPPTIINPAAAPTSSQVKEVAGPALNKSKDLPQQIEELGSSNQQLRTQVEQQTKELDALKEDLRRLRDDLKAQKNAKPSLDRKPSRKPPSE